MTKFDDLQFLSTFVFLSVCLFLLPISTICIKNETIRGGVSRFQFASETESESILIRAATVSRGGTFYCIFFFVVIRVAVVVVVGAAHAHSWRCCCCWERRRSRNEPVAGCEANEMRATVLRAVELSAQNAVAAGSRSRRRHVTLPCWLTATMLLSRC